MYLCWRKLGVHPTQFHDLPWWCLRVALSGFRQEFSDPDADPEDPALVRGDAGALAAAGFTVQQVEVSDDGL